MKHVISLGAGVQSSTMALMAAHGEITPMPVAAIFADTQAEPKAVYEWLDWLEAKLPFPVIRVSRGNLAEDSLKLRTSKKTGNRYNECQPPAFVIDGRKDKTSILSRACTKNHKIVPIRRAISKLRDGREQITQWVGISRDEAHRMKPSPVKYIINRWPLVDMRMTRHGCLDWMKSNGYPQPPRSACYFCPYRSDASWRHLIETDLDAFDAAVDYERKLRCVSRNLDGMNIKALYLHRSMQPLDSIDFDALTDDPQLSLFGNECEGMCGV